MLIGREEYHWFIYPMVNPDGVIHGHSRTNLKGYDINRCWGKENIHLSKEVHSLNASIAQLK